MSDEVFRQNERLTAAKLNRLLNRTRSTTIVSDELDGFGAEPGTILVRETDGWEALGPGDVGNVLTVGADSIPEWDAPGGSVTASDLTMATNRILGRSTAGTGAVEEITPGRGLLLSSGSLVSQRGCRVTRSADKTISNNTHTVIDFDTEVFKDDSGAHDNVTNNSRLSAPSTATRVRLTMYGVLSSANTTGLRNIVLLKNSGGTYVGANSIQSVVLPGLNTDQSPMQITTGWMPYTPGDYYEFDYFQNTGGNMTLICATGLNISYFEIEWV